MKRIKVSAAAVASDELSRKWRAARDLPTTAGLTKWSSLHNLLNSDPRWLEADESVEFAPLRSAPTATRNDATTKQET